MDEKTACARLKQKFVAAGFAIADDVPFDEDGVRFDVDGFDAEARVGFEYVTDEAGDGWDVDAAVIETLAARREAGELYILVVDERDAPDAKALDRAADAFLAELAGRGVVAGKPAAKAGGAAKPARTRAAKPTAKPATKPAAKPAKKKSRR